MNLHALYLAICLVESGNNPGAIGRHGERGPAQISRAVWKQHTTTPFVFANRPKASETVAIRHLNWLVKNGVSEYPWDLAYAWNCGRTATLKRILGVSQSAAGSRYAWRVDRTYNDLLAKSKRTSKPSNRP